MCSFVSVFVATERCLALRSSRVIPRSAVEGFVSGKIRDISPEPRSIVGRIVRFVDERSPGADELKAFARLELSRMERGLFLLEVVIGAALFWAGTVTGLTQVFCGFPQKLVCPNRRLLLKNRACSKYHDFRPSSGDTNSSGSFLSSASRRRSRCKS